MLHELLDIHQASKFLGISVRSLRGYRMQDIGPESFVVNGRLLYRPEALRQWLDAQIAATTRGGIDTTPALT